MDNNSRLRAIAWMYALLGAYALIEQVVSLFSPLDDPIVYVWIFWPRVNVAILMLPIGVGLMRHNNLCRRLAVAASWTAVGLVGVILAILGLTTLGVGELGWEPPKVPVSGDVVARLMGTVLIGVPLFVWQLRQLHSKGVRSLTVLSSGPASQQAAP